MLLALLLALTVLLWQLPGAAANAARRRRPVLVRPRARVVAVVVLLELALLFAWILLGRPR